jgi:hypothetical protein
LKKDNPTNSNSIFSYISYIIHYLSDLNGVWSDIVIATMDVGDNIEIIEFNPSNDINNIGAITTSMR